MLQTIICYICLPAITLYLGILNNRPWLFVLFFAELFLFTLEAVMAGCISRCLSIHVNMPSKSYMEQKNIRLTVSVENNSVLPVTRMAVLLRCSGNHLSPKKYKLAGNLGAKRRTEFVINAGTFSAGVYDFYFDGLLLYDYLGLSVWKKRLHQSHKIYILPKFYNLPVLFSGKEIPIDTMSNPDIPGPDLSEIYELKEYRPGDALNRIHWKKSARAGEFYVRNGSGYFGVSAMFFIQKPDQREVSHMVQIAVSFMQSLLLQGKHHYVLYLSDGILQRVLIQKEEDIHKTAQILLDYQSEPGRIRKKKQHKKEQADNTVLWKETISMDYYRQYPGEARLPECYLYQEKTHKNIHTKKIWVLEQPGNIKNRININKQGLEVENDE